jgi:hypothetical protein
VWEPEPRGALLAPAPSAFRTAARAPARGRAPARQQAQGAAVYATEASPSVYGKLKIVGVGARGISAISRLMGACVR